MLGSRAKKQWKVMGILMAVIFIVAGMLVFAMAFDLPLNLSFELPMDLPVDVALISVWAIFVLWIMHGSYRVVVYIQSCKEERSIWLLLSGLLSLVLSGCLLYDVCAVQFFSTADRIGSIALLLAGYEIVLGMAQFLSIRKVKKLGKSVSLLAMCGMLHVAGGLFLVVYPMLGTVAFEGLVAVYFLVAGVALLLEFLRK